MQCINTDCDGMATRVTESRPTQAVHYRRRECPVCNRRYTTIEVLAPDQTIPDAARRPRHKEAA